MPVESVNAEKRRKTAIQLRKGVASYSVVPYSFIFSGTSPRLGPLCSCRCRSRDKVISYLLNAAHRYGGSKARFFADFGFRLDDWESLAHALREHGRRNEVVVERETGFGPRYEVDGPLNAPDGRAPRVRTVWQLDDGEVAPRLITAYPLEARR